MQNIHKIQISVSAIVLALVLAFFAFTSTAFAQTADQTGTLRICSVLAGSTGVHASADATVPAGTFALSLATTTDFLSPITTHTFNAQAFAHNTTVDGIPMHCTDAVSVPFGQYYYNNVSMTNESLQWSSTKYFDSTNTVDLVHAFQYTQGLFTTDPADDLWINTVSDGLVVVNDATPHRTVVVLSTYSDVLDQYQNRFCADNSMMTYHEFVVARALGAVTYALDTNTTTNKAVAVVHNATGCTLPMSLSVYKMFDGSHLSTQEYFAGTPEIQATSSTTFITELPNCLAQVDFWYGTAPTTLLDNHNYGELPLPVVLTWALPRMTGVDVNGGIIGPFCTHAVNTPPIITLIGANPLNIVVGTPFSDPGATALDAEDGNITHKIVVTGTVNPQTPGTYVLTYTVTDSGGLSASTIRTVIVLPVASCSADANMISNGGFESPKLTTPWISVHINTPEFFWTSYDTVVYPYVEVQAGYTEGSATWMPHSGSQYAEIDGGTSHDVSQVLATIPGNTYTLSYWLSPRPNQTVATNVMNVFANGMQIDTYTGAGLETTSWSQKTVTFTATTTATRISFTQGQNTAIGEGVFLDDVSVICNPVETPVNTPPTITLVGSNPATLTVGQAWVEPGATANDREDGNITNKIVITGTVGTTTPGTYTLTYSVTDSGGLSATTTRQVIVSNGGGGGPTTGKITFCTLFANMDNVLATSSLGLPTGTFVINLATTTSISGSTINTKTWTASAFTPNKKVIGTVNDADCVTYDNLVLGTYYYSQLSVNGTNWIVSSTSPKYNDQFITPVNNIFDLFSYSPELFNATSSDDVSRNVNADGQIVVSADRREHTLVMVTKYEPATTTPPVCTVNCGGGGGGGGNPPCTANCGGGGGGGNGPIVSSLSITNEKVVEITPGVALVTWTTNLPATKEVGYGNASQPASFIVAPFGYATSTARVSSPLETIHSYTIAIERGKTYYFRPVSTDFKTTVAGIELVLNPGTGIGGGNEGGNNGGSTSCYYLFDWLKKGWNNNPVEVKKLQVFLRDLEGYSVRVTGVYDDQTITSLNAFQMRYKADVLTPWGHTAPTSFTYITTKKKVNEIYCKMAFPVTALEQKEIDAYRVFLQGLTNAGVTITPPTQEQIDAPAFIDTTDVGVLPGLATTTPGTGQGTLAGAEANGTSTIGRLTANVIASSKKMGNFMAALFTWPWDWAKALFDGNDDLECAPTSVFSNWFNWILVIIILTMAYLWYRERRENKKAAKLNEELELLNK